LLAGFTAVVCRTSNFAEKTASGEGGVYAVIRAATRLFCNRTHPVLAKFQPFTKKEKCCVTKEDQN